MTIKSLSSLSCRVSLNLGIFLILIIAFQELAAQTSSDTLIASQDLSLRGYLQSLDSNQSTRYIAAFQHLRGQGDKQAIVYMLGSNWCGSGGCETFVLEKNGQSWRAISKIPITRPPIRILRETSYGWHSIGVLVAGGGILPGYEAVLRFNGKSYPRNPTMPPALREKVSEGETVISSTVNATALYP